MKFQAPAELTIAEPRGERAAASALHRDGEVQTSSVSRTAQAESRGQGRSQQPRSRSLPNLVWFSRQLYLLVSSGTPLVDAVESLASQARDPQWQRVLRDIHGRLEQGGSLSEAMTAHPRSFDSVCCSLVAAGESSGEMSTMLNRVAELTHQQIQLRRAVIGALIYPALLLGAAGGALGIMIVVVLPRFSSMFESMQVPLPSSTAFLVNLSEFIRTQWPWLGAGLVALAVSGVLLLRLPATRRLLEAIWLRVPRFGRLYRSFMTARIARLLGTLVVARVPMLTAMRLVRSAMRSELYVEMLRSAERSVERGEPVSVTFVDPILVDPVIYESVRSGERSGQVGPLLLDVSSFLDDENQTTVRTLTSLIEPIILIILGLVVGFIAISLFLPLFDMTANAQGGSS